ncbi:MAG: Stp1/IreP family PP2C-type Ser/Thr phosphatase [Gammaproteobacteria bacterium]|nr:Stp1/IreP family PP2C-type Ser/Thr phosphatase [Gammaproteobacteria bacterium]
MNLKDSLEIVNQSDVGRRRPHNEDSTLSDPSRGLVILADGMGGYKAGEVASAIAATTIHHEISSGLKRLRPGRDHTAEGLHAESAVVRDAIVTANGRIFSTAQKETDCHGMGTTIVVCLFHNDCVTVAHVGDSRVYRLRAGTFAQITKDHSLIQELIDRGLYSPEDAARNAPKNLVTRALGIEPEVRVDVAEEQVKVGDLYLLCSDGLNDMVDDEEIRLTLSKYSGNLARATEELIRTANANGGRDNTSIIMVRVTENYAVQDGPLAKILKKLF